MTHATRARRLARGIGRRLKFLAEATGSLAELSRLSGVPYTTLWSVANDGVVPGADILVGLHLATNVSIPWLSGGMGQPWASGYQYYGRARAIQERPDTAPPCPICGGAQGAA